MKKHLITLLLGLSIPFSHSIAQSVIGAKFEYDNKGNRIKRYMTLVLPKHGGEKDTASGGEPNKSILKDDNLLLEAYPNPTNNDLTITNLTWKTSDKALVTVGDIQGKTVISQEFSQAKDIVSFTKLTPGTYMVHYFLNDKPTKVWRIIKL